MKPEMYEIYNRVEDTHWWFQARRAIVLRLLDAFVERGKPLRVLDIGCGTGMMLNALRRFGEVVGVDPNDAAIAYSRRKIRPPCRVVKGHLPEALPRGQRFEIVTALDVLEHIDDDAASLRAIHEEVLHPRGTFMLTVPAYGFLWSGHDEMNLHKRRYTVRELKRKLLSAGFRTRKCSYYNMFLFPAGLAGKFYGNIRHNQAPRAHFDEVPPRWVNSWLYRIFSSERFLLPHLNFPFGVSIVAIASHG
jgi:SAM-dependent methyltransferase